VRHFGSFYGPGCCLLCAHRPVVVATDRNGDTADLCHTHWAELGHRSHGGIRALRPYWPATQEDP
jgi:hypothetical protein